MEKTCVVCKLPFEGRADAVTCSKKCRVTLSRKAKATMTLNAAEPPPGDLSATVSATKNAAISVLGVTYRVGTPSPAPVSVTSGTDKPSQPVSATPAMLSVTPDAVCVPKGEAVYKSVHGREWDIMSDGYARGDARTSAYQRIESKTPYAYFRIIMQETGFDIFQARITKKEFDKVDWKKLALPNFEMIGKSVRDRLPDVDHSKAVGK